MLDCFSDEIYWELLFLQVTTGKMYWRSLNILSAVNYFFNRNNVLWEKSPSVIPDGMAALPGIIILKIKDTSVTVTDRTTCEILTLLH